MTESPTSTNSFIDGDSQFNQNNCLKRKRTLEGELDRTSMEMKLIKEKFDLQNSLMEQLDENKKIVGANNKLSEELEKSTIGNEMLKKENDKNLEELAKIKKKCSDLIDDKSKAIVANNQLQLEVNFLKIKIEKLEKEGGANFKEVNKVKEENQKLTKINENIYKEKIQLNKDLEKFKTENTKLKEEKDLNLKELNNYRTACEIPEDEKMILIKQNNQLSLELTKCKNELALNLNLVRYVSLNNKINKIGDHFTCCDNKCINANLSNGTCINGQGFIRVQDNGIVKYHLMEDEENNSQINFYAQHSFKKELGFCCHYSLFYYEVTMIEETKDYCYAMIGLNENAPVIFLLNGPGTLMRGQLYQKSSWKSGDVFGYGIIFPSKKDSKILPYVFFTKNGRRIGNKFSLKKDTDNLFPYFKLRSCSIEINFGNDLENEPFVYNTLKHNI